MRGLRLVILFGAAVAALSASTACGGGGSGAGGGTSSSSSSSSGTGGATSSSSSSSTSSSSSSTSSSSSSSGGGSAPGYCTKPCSAAADCCPPGDPSCPGPSYPYNYVCTNGACYAPECSATSDCTAINPKLDCISVSGFDDCAFVCTTDAQCTAPATCSGMDDNGKKYCIASGGGGCTDDASCAGFGKCIDKVCVCDMDADCTNAGFTKCAK